MRELITRVKDDLKADLRKTVLLAFLGFVFAAVLLWRTLGGEQSPAPFSLPGIPSNSIFSLEERPVTAGGAKGHGLPAFLSQALPFESIEQNPFEPLFQQALCDPPEPDFEPPAVIRLEEEGGAQAGESLPPMVLSGTVRGSDTPMAMVDGCLLRIGDEYNGFILSEIGEFYVLFASGERRFRLEMKLFPEAQGKFGEVR